ncbi:MAG: ribonuclease domain-containing protein [Noviherbaspirillum sp.]
MISSANRRSESGFDRGRGEAAWAALHGWVGNSQDTGRFRADVATGALQAPKEATQALGQAAALGVGLAAGGTAGAASALNVEANNRQLHPDETKWIQENAKRFAQQQGISEQEAEQRLAQQAYRQVQSGVTGGEDEQARGFLAQAHGMLPVDPGCPACGPGYLFYATPGQKANPAMYAAALPQTQGFYQENGLAQPTLQQIVQSVVKEEAQRSTALRQMVLAAATVGTLALAPAMSGVASEIAAFASNPVGYCLGNPNGCRVAAEAAAYTVAGVPQPESVALPKAGAALGAKGVVTSEGMANAVTYAGLKLDLKTTEAANEVVNSLRTTGQLPSNYVTKGQAYGQGWQEGKAVNNYVPGGQIGGDVFRNADNLLPSAPGRVWYEADIGLSNTMIRGNPAQPASRILYSSDGMLYVTPDHYKTMVLIGRWKN